MQCFALRIASLLGLSCILLLVDGSRDCSPSGLTFTNRGAEETCSYTAKNGTLIVVPAGSKDDCDEHSKFCCWSNRNCYRKGDKKPAGAGAGTRGVGGGDGGGEEKIVFTYPEKLDKSRFLTLGPPIPIGCYPPDPFPIFCNPRRNEKYVLYPPVDIPYCVRIPCSENRARQLIYEKNQFECGSQPGCYFDEELYELREYFGNAVLPGVPVCQYAIRNEVFQREAKKAADVIGFWNPYFTKCALDHFNIWEAEPEGCELLTALRLFNVAPKMAGWKGIISRDCRLINACWVPGQGCYYPVHMDDITVHTGQKFTYNRFEAIHGRPKCGVFDPRTPYSFLKSYHQCLISGCSVDANAASVYYHYLYAIGEAMSAEEHWKYWYYVERGDIGPDNIDDMPWDYKVPSGPKGHGGMSDDGLFHKRPRHSPAMKKCGIAFKRYGGRPCRPPYLPDLNEHRWCPYQPFDMPRFKPLKGSLVGCCDINPCYLPKSDIGHAYSGPSYYYSTWSFFGPCSQTCGWGKHTRYRKCISHNPKLCKEKLRDIHECRDAECGKWSPWSDWTPCASDRRCGIQTRKRRCEPRGANCHGEDEESQACGPWWCS